VGKNKLASNNAESFSKLQDFCDHSKLEAILPYIEALTSKQQVLTPKLQ